MWSCTVPVEGGPREDRDRICVEVFGRPRQGDVVDANHLARGRGERGEIEGWKNGRAASEGARGKVRWGRLASGGAVVHARQRGGGREPSWLSASPAR